MTCTLRSFDTQLRQCSRLQLYEVSKQFSFFSPASHNCACSLMPAVQCFTTVAQFTFFFFDLLLCFCLTPRHPPFFCSCLSDCILQVSVLFLVFVICLVWFWVVMQHAL